MDESIHDASKLSLLIAEIASAFDGVEREDGITLHEAEAIDSYATAQERVAARKLDIDTRWQEVPDEWIERYPSVIFHYDAKSFRYYLPAVMIRSLRQLGDSPVSDSSTPDNLLSVLSENRWQQWCEKSFTPEQRAAVSHFVQLMSRKYWHGSPQTKRLQEYWKHEGDSNPTYPNHS